MKQFLNLLERPFREHLSLLVTFFILITALEIYADIIDPPYRSMWHWGLTTARGIVDCYFLALVYSLIPNTLKKGYLVIILVLLTTFFLIDVFAVLNFSRVFDYDIAAIILGTNPSEMKEFMLTYLSFKIIGIIVAFVVLFVSLYFFSKKASWMNKTLSRLALVGVVLSLLMNLYMPRNFIGIITEKLLVFSYITETPDLKDYLHHPKMEVVAHQPQNVVMIIGESYTKSHASLYGYKMPTNPYLSKLQDDSLLVAFDQVRSDALSTIPAFKTFMSTFHVVGGDSLQWYECLTLPETVKQLSYQTYWISNQSYKGLCDNIPTRYAELCDSLIFVGNKFSGGRKKDYDEAVIPPLQELPKDSLRCFFIHLMGSHNAYDLRYPEGFGPFTEADYPEIQSAHRKDFATYDNSVLYNDSVVYEIMNLFEGKEAIVLYFPDHAEDLYESSADYCGHGKPNNPMSVAAGSNIPFLVYMSPLYQKKFPEMTERIKQAVHRPYSTGYFLYTLVDVMGGKFKNNADVENYSLFHN